jgi:S-DNA-T family DNA segregation ATPase FtsK/SpoIIIE
MMKQTDTSDPQISPLTPAQRLTKHMTEGGFIVVLALAILILCSLLTHQATDPSQNAGGQVGDWIAIGLFAAFGYCSYLLPIFVFYLAGSLLLEHRAFATIHQATLTLRAIGLVLFLLSGCGLINLQCAPNLNAGIGYPGGIIGQMLVVTLTRAFNIQGAVLMLFALFMVGISWVTGLSWGVTIEWIGRMTLQVLKGLRRHIQQAVAWTKDLIAEFRAEKFHPEEEEEEEKESITPISKPSFSLQTLRSPKEVPPKLAPSLPTVLQQETKIEQSVDVKKKTTASKFTSKMSDNIETALPSLSLLSPGRPKKILSSSQSQELEALSRNVEQHLLDFGIQVSVVGVHPGPVITRFELQLAAGVKVSRLSALAKDLARSLSVTSVRIVEIIPGKTVVGIELPNPERHMVCLSDVLSAEVYQQAHSPLSLALGVDIAGHPMVVDLAKMPHLLVAGTTGSGKSVGINAMILSLLFKATPKEVRLIMVDPKMLELSIYDGIPHLLTPVVTDMKEAASALRWCVNEMERRYRLMAAVGVRNLAGFNAMVTDANTNGDGLLDPLWKISDGIETEAPKLETLPYVVVIIDELADMMMVVGKKVEQLIARIAQKARAAGIHLILATQRPSVDVLTGLIKSNIPTRISFQVSSRIDSRTILDQMGADQLLGHGDMLFLAPGTGAPLRVHGAFVDDQEVHRVADAWRARGAPDYIEAITQISGENEGEFGEEKSAVEEADPLYDEAVAFVMQTRKASISSVQRRFKIGYNRAARLVEEMERCGLVGPLEGGFRDVLVNPGSNHD